MSTPSTTASLDKPQRAGRDGMAIDPVARLKIVALDRPELFRSVVEAIKKLARPIPDGGKRAMPPYVKVVWGPGTETYDLPRFVGVIESVSVKCQMFSREGQVLRATVTVKLKQADLMSFKG